MIREEHCNHDFRFPFIMYRPEQIATNYPLVVQLHGAGEVGLGGADLPLVEKNGFSKMLRLDREYPCIFVMPQCPPDSFWIAEIPHLHRFIEEIVEQYGIDVQRIYLIGLSMGGYGTWATACRYPNLFAAIVPICGGGMAWKASILEMPIWAWHGTEDDVVFPTESINMIQKIRKYRNNDPEIRLTLVDGVGHNVWEIACSEEVLAWMLSKKRPKRAAGNEMYDGRE